MFFKLFWHAGTKGQCRRALRYNLLQGGRQKTLELTDGVTSSATKERIGKCYVIFISSRLRSN